jgi:N utilization substance protein B
MDVMRDCFDKGMNDNAWAYVRRIIAAFEQNAAQVDALIQEHSNKWSIGHMAKVELSILRLGVCELQFMEDEIAPGITINECVELAKRYASEKSAKFVNGVLAAVLTDKEAALK